MILRAKNIYKTFYEPEKVEILSDVSLDVKKGSSIAITGASGEGKTTLLHILGTLESFDSGSIEFGYGDPYELRRKHIGFIFQNYNLMEDFSTLENVLMPDRVARKRIDEKKGIDLLKLVGLEARANFPAKLLSGGEKQRVAIARAFCNSPSLILADEPSGSLDHKNALAIHDLLLKCVKEFNASLILVTHNSTIASLCEEVYILNSGKLTRG